MRDEAGRHTFRVVVVGGGAAGFFSAITCAESIPDAEVVVLEKSPELLAKVTISGGGRCNVTHACYDPARLSVHYPRGGRELIGPFHRWQPRDTVDWFESRGVALKTEADGRLFPVSDSSKTIVDCLKQSAESAGVMIRTGCGVVSVRREDRGFELGLADGEVLRCDRLLIATGGNQNGNGLNLAEQLGHTIVSPCPSLFTFACIDPRINELPGVSAVDVEVGVEATRLNQRGPILITHWGWSGPAVLKLSAWGARILHDMDYRFVLWINWVPALNREELAGQLRGMKTSHPARAVVSGNPFSIASRLWSALCLAVPGVDAQTTWAGLSKASLHGVADMLHRSRFHIDGKSLNKDEFVTCGGVKLNEVDFKTMASREVPGLYFAGEILDIDGVTGGFNFQSAWTTGWIAGKSMGQEVG